MNKYILLLVMLMISTACGRHESVSSAPDAVSAVAPAPMALRAKMAGAERSFAAEQSLTEMSEPNAGARKYIAFRHHLQIETPAEQMQEAFDATVKHCEALNCQMLSANYQRETPYSPPSASLSIRVPPRNVEVFLTGLAK
ncbi:MAG: DUF4349 domain-containing protein, partial [Pseudomonadota bacterium]